MIKIPRMMIYRSIILSKNIDNEGYSLKRMGTKYHVNVMGILCAMYFGNLLTIRKSSKVVLVLLLKALNNLIINFLITISRK